MPCTPISDNDSRTSSSLNGLMMAVTSFMKLSPELVDLPQENKPDSSLSAVSGFVTRRWPETDQTNSRKPLLTKHFPAPPAALHSSQRLHQCMGHMPLSRKLAISLDPTDYGRLVTIRCAQIATIEPDRTTTVRTCTHRCAKIVQPGAPKMTIDAACYTAAHLIPEADHARAQSLSRCPEWPCLAVVQRRDRTAA